MFLYISILFLGVYLSLAFYHLMVFFGRKEDKKNFYYFILLLCTIYYITFKSINQELPIDLFPDKIDKLFLIFCPAIGILGMALFSYYILKLQKMKKFAFIGYLFLVFMPTTIFYIVFLFLNNYRLSQVFLAPFTILYGIIYWIKVTKIFFNTKSQYDLPKLYVFISITIYYISFISYPFLMLLKFSNHIQILIPNIGMLIMALMSAYALTNSFNQEHSDLIDLKYTLEQKVADRTKQLEEANQQKTNFFINISHEIRTPLTLLKSYLDKYINKIKDKKDEDLQILKKSYDKLERDILNFFDIERFNKGKIIYNNNQTSDFTIILNENLILFSELAKGRKISIKKYINDNILLKIDPNGLDRIINNIIDNAIKYNKNEGGTIEVTLTQDENNVNFIVKNTGDSINEEQQKHIFESY